LEKDFTVGSLKKLRLVVTKTCCYSSTSWNLWCFYRNSLDNLTIQIEELWVGNHQ